MRNLKAMFLFAAIVAVSIVSSCGGGNGDDPKSDQELTVEALTGDWSLNASESQFGDNVTDDLTATVSISSTMVSITGGTLAEYVSDVSFSVQDNGTLLGNTASITKSDLSLVASSVTVGINDALTKITVSFSTEAARVAGTGSWTLVFDKAAN
jgi:hypothetical protein